jgi:WD40 repeat protein
LQGCPDIWELDGGDFAVIGADITNLAGALPPSAGCGPDERMVRIPRKTLVLAKPAWCSGDMTPPNDGNYDSALSPDGRLVATSHNGRVVLNDLVTGRLVCEFPQTSIARCVSFSADSAKLLAGNWDGAARLWDVKTGQLVWTSPAFRNAVGAVAFSSNGVFAVGSWDGTIKIWDADADQALATLTGHKAAVIQLAFSSDGRTLAGGSDDSTVKLWNLAIGREVVTIKTDVPQYYVKFSPDDKILATGGGDRKVHFWRAASLAEIAHTEKADAER